MHLLLHSVVFTLAVMSATAQEDLQCHQEGQCSGLFVGSIDTDSYNLCLDQCVTNDNCNWITYFGDNKDCIQFMDCPSVDDTCDSCFSGQKECPPHGPVCNAPGLCIGHFISASEANSADKCLRLCQSVDECMWYSFLADQNQCILTADCVTLDDSCSDCVSGERECLAESVSESLIFVVGSDYTDYGSVEVVDLNGPTCMGFADGPAVAATVGVFIEDHPMVCGGEFLEDYDYENTAYDSCFIYKPDTDRWLQSYSMVDERIDAAAVQLSETKWWVTGGWAERNESYQPIPLKSTEMFIAGEGFSGFVDLPEAKFSHNLVKINDTHVMLLGGERKYIPENGTHTYNNKTWLFNLETESWSDLPDMPIPTAETQAGLVTLPDGRKEVVVAGGWNTNATQIFSLDSQTWRLGPDFPLFDFNRASSVQYGDTFLVIGGEISYDETVRTIYTFSTEAEEWVQLQQSLIVPRLQFTAFFIPDDFITCRQERQE